MGKRKITLNEIRRRKAEVAHQMELTKRDVQSDFYELTHPFKRTSSLFSLPGLSSVGDVFNKARTAFNIASKVVSFFRKR